MTAICVTPCYLYQQNSTFASQEQFSWAILYFKDLQNADVTSSHSYHKSNKSKSSVEEKFSNFILINYSHFGWPLQFNSLI